MKEILRDIINKILNINVIATTFVITELIINIIVLWEVITKKSIIDIIWAWYQDHFVKGDLNE